MKEGMKSLPKFEHGPSVTWGGYYLGTCRATYDYARILHHTCLFHPYKHSRILIINAKLRT